MYTLYNIYKKVSVLGVALFVACFLSLAVVGMGALPVEAQTPTFTANSVGVWEDAGTVDITVSIPSASTTDTTVGLSTISMRACGGAGDRLHDENLMPLVDHLGNPLLCFASGDGTFDYTGFTDKIVTIPAGQTSVTTQVTIVDDTILSSNFSGLSYPFMKEKLAGNINPRILAVEPAACPSITKGEYRYDFGDTIGMTPLIKMHTLGHGFVPDPIHAGGLRYHGMSPLVSHIVELGLMEAVAIAQVECFEAALQFARTEGIIPAPEPTHAIAGALREAAECRESGEEKVILIALCGHGHFDMAAYDTFLSGELHDYEYPSEAIAAALAEVPVVA